MLALKSHYVSIGQTHCIGIQDEENIIHKCDLDRDVVAGDLRLDPHLARAHRLSLQLLHRPRPRSHKTGPSPKLVFIPSQKKLTTNLFESLFSTDLEAEQPPAAAPGSQQQHLDHPLPLHLLALHLHRIPCCWHHCLSGGHWNGLNQKIKNDYSLLFNLCRCMVSSCT